MFTNIERRIGVAIVNHPSTPNIGDPSIDSDAFFLPSIILWSPYVTHPNIFPLDSIICPTCGHPARHTNWKDGSSSSLQPRLIPDIENIAYLVSTVYSCDNGHRLLAHDESVLPRFPSSSMIPFVLYRRTGVTISLASMCTSLSVNGLNFHNMETFIIHRRWTTFAKQCDLLHQHQILTASTRESELDFWGIYHFPSTERQYVETVFPDNVS